MPTKIITCTCKSHFQDAEYGTMRRVANEMRTGQLKCTVCGTIAGTKVTTTYVGKISEPEVVEPEPKEKKSKGKKSKEKIPKQRIDRSRKFGKK